MGLRVCVEPQPSYILCQDGALTRVYRRRPGKGVYKGVWELGLASVSKKQPELPNGSFRYRMLGSL